MASNSNGSKRGVIFSGMRPTGLLHLGNYIGALQNWVALQDEFDCIYCAVDIHALTTVESRDDTDRIQANIEDMILDWLAAGIDPERSIVFVQSHVPEVMTLHTLLSMVTPLGWLMRVPTFKGKGAADGRDRGDRQLRPGRLSRAPDRRHHPVQGGYCARRTGPDTAH